MGCTASSSEAIVSTSIIGTNDIIDGKPEYANINNHEHEITENADLDTNSYFKEFESSGDTIIIKVHAPTMCSQNEPVDHNANKLDCKNGFVAFEINLDGTVEPTIDGTKHPLPRRLKHLEPLECAPRLTAEELNEKLEKAEKMRMTALAKRKIGVSRQHNGTLQSGPNQDKAGDTSPENLMRENDSANSECTYLQTDNNPALSMATNLEEHVSLKIDNKDGTFHHTDSNNNAKECIVEKIPILFKKRAILGLNIQMPHGTRRRLNAFAESDKRRL